MKTKQYQADVYADRTTYDCFQYIRAEGVVEAMEIVREKIIERNRKTRKPLPARFDIFILDQEKCGPPEFVGECVLKLR